MQLLVITSLVRSHAYSFSNTQRPLLMDSGLSHNLQQERRGAFPPPATSCHSRTNLPPAHLSRSAC